MELDGLTEDENAKRIAEKVVTAKRQIAEIHDAMKAQALNFAEKYQEISADPEIWPGFSDRDKAYLGATMKGLEAMIPTSR